MRLGRTTRGFRTGLLRAAAALSLALVALVPTMPVASSWAADRTVRAFAAGSGAADLGVSFGNSTEDQEEEGPQAIAVDRSGDLFVLDQVNGRILTFDPKAGAAAPRALDLPKDVQPTDLLVRGSDIYVWDGRIHALQVLGRADAPTRGLTETRSAEGADEATTSAFAQLGSRDIEAESSPTRGIRRNTRNDLAHQMVDTHGAGRATADVALTDKGAGATLSIRHDGEASATTIRMRVRDRLGTVAFLDIDQTGRIYVLAENIPLRIEDAAFAFVARFSPTGAFEGVYEVPLSSTTISRRCVTVSPSGDVYFLRTLKTSVDVVGLGYRPMPDAKIIELAPRGNAALFAWANSKNIAVAVGPLTRQKVIQTALAYEGLTWTLAPPNYGRDDEMCNGFAGRSRVPLYMLGKEGETVKGVPYCWGCQGSIQQFATRLQKGTVAGNVCTRNSVRPDVAGVDCSSFVSAAWGLSTHFSTSAIPTIASPLSNPWDLQPGDALDKPGSHVVLFMGFTPNREAMVMEASPNACKGRVCRNVYPLSWLLSRGFVPVRYRGLADAAPVDKRAAQQN